jgi:hypothetical protein
MDALKCITIANKIGEKDENVASIEKLAVNAIEQNTLHGCFADQRIDVVNCQSQFAIYFAKNAAINGLRFERTLRVADKSNRN